MILESVERAADAFAVGELPDVGPWDPANGLCRALVVGDSLVEADLRAQIGAFSFMGCESIVDGLAARSLSEGWQCLADGGRSMAIVVVPEPEPGNPTCRPSGLELLELWSDFTRASSVTVIALGTNDAGMFSDATWIRRWTRAADLTSGPLVFVTVGARPNDRWVDNAERYNATLRWWCPSEPRCTLAEWDLTAPARDPNSYTDHVHLTRSVGEMRAVFLAAVARQVAVGAPAGPRRWVAPPISLPPPPTTTTGVPGSGAPFPSLSPQTTVPLPTLPGATTTSTIPNTPVASPAPANPSVPANPSDPAATTTTLLGQGP